MNYQKLAKQIKSMALTLGFHAVGITDTNLSGYESHLHEWLEKKYAGEMDYIEKRLELRLHPTQLMPNTKSIISVAVRYPIDTTKKNHIANFALVDDYHRVIKNLLQQLADQIKKEIGEFYYRACVDTAPVLEKALAEKAGIGWIGKNTLMINKDFGSFFCLGELFTDLPLPIDSPAKNYCGQCEKCIQHCPTKTLKNSTLDARGCISYLTMTHQEKIPEALQKKMNGHIFGCDTCQQVCPWNQKCQPPATTPFEINASLSQADLFTMSKWSEADFIKHTKHSTIQKIGYEQFLKNVHLALKNLAL